MNIKSATMIACIIPAMLLLSGCARRINIKTTAYADSSVIPNGFCYKKSFYLEGEAYANGAKQNNKELEIKELAKKISLMLKSRGYSIAERNRADYLLFFDYGCHAETVTYDVLKYIPGPTLTSNGTVNGSAGGKFFNSQYRETTTTPGTFIWVPEQRTAFTKSLNFHIYGSGGYEEIWKGNSVGVDGYADLRTFLDFLVIAMFDLFGNNGATNYTMLEDNESVALLRQQMSNQYI